MDPATDADAFYHAAEPGPGDRLGPLLARGVDPRGTKALLRAVDYSNAGALEQGVALPRGVQKRVGDPALRAFLAGWAARYPGQVVDA